MEKHNGNYSPKELSLHKEYERIMQRESKIAGKNWIIPPVREVFKTNKQIGQIVESSSVLRSYNNRYGLTRDKCAYESVAAHTNLCMTILDRCLSYMYGPDMDLPDMYTYRELMEALRRHDLPENIIGDIPDNGEAENSGKRATEITYFNAFASYSPLREHFFEENVNRLLTEMEDKSSFFGRMLYVTDKISALFITLWHDSVGRHPLMHPKSRKISGRDFAEMQICDDKVNGCYRASEMWAIDYFKMRELEQYDDTGYFTALIVAYTLAVNGHWYIWRDHDYR